MAGTTTTSRRTQVAGSEVGGGPLNDLTVNYNLLVDDVAALRNALGRTVTYQVEDLSAGTDIAARAILRAPAAITVASCHAIHEANSAGIDSGNTAIIALRNITEGVDVATITLVADVLANTATSVTVTAANVDVASADILGIVVTQGATADLGAFTLQFQFIHQTVDAAGDLLAAKIGDTTGTAITATGA